MAVHDGVWSTRRPEWFAGQGRQVEWSGWRKPQVAGARLRRRDVEDVGPRLTTDDSVHGPYPLARSLLTAARPAYRPRLSFHHHHRHPPSPWPATETTRTPGRKRPPPSSTSTPPSSTPPLLAARPYVHHLLTNMAATLHSKSLSEYYDPCQEAATRSIRCLHRNGGDRDLCSDYFQYAALGTQSPLFLGRAAAAMAYRAL